MNKELLEKINETFNRALANSKEDTQLQIKILKNNINALFAEYDGKVSGPETLEEPQTLAVSQNVDIVQPNLEVATSVVPKVQTTVESSVPTSVVTPPVVETLEDDTPDTLTQADMKSILIVDDSSMIRNYLERIFINEYNIIMAVDGQDAVEKVEKNRSNLNIILLDLVMPKADGFFVLEYLQKNSVDVPVIIISGDTSKESVEKAFEYGVVDMIKKPFDSDIIKEKIVRYSK